MIVLDTNVLSYLMRDDPTVVRWTESQPPQELRITSVTRAEVLAGIKQLPEGRRKDDLSARANRLLESLPAQGLPFDDEAADEYASLLAQRRTEGRPISHEDCQILAITKSHGAILATRDANLTDCGVAIIDPYR
ncbi:type II toxin-antitoxin system VapC family toxin [Tessaracoccus caeni]|uniref:type II toxin-antitoxin system VapC family toxin n=1 Tax=Tessaracoccus caeni TaxID=3031239 RepID=UPI0023DBFA11|nr:type II toxin-antitoxin system VapC family toxin [Tessaracoccus caeni]MDF1487874.1 type II toxin-antitoxin system VapC family toxin [Tessaracoccus caeni]